MLVSGLELDTVRIFNTESREMLAEITDRGIRCATGVAPLVVPKFFSLNKNSLVTRGQYLFYEDSPEELYIVDKVSDEFFEMVRVSLDDNKMLTLNSNIRRRYFNNADIVSLKDYGLVLLSGKEDPNCA